MVYILWNYCILMFLKCTVEKMYERIIIMIINIMLHKIEIIISVDTIVLQHPNIINLYAQFR